MIEARSVHEVRGGHVLLHDVSILLRPGELVALVGPNGAGKSTLVTLLAGIRAPRQGEIRLNGRSLTDHSASGRARLLAYVAQQQEVAWDLTVGEVVALGTGDSRLLRRARSRFDLGNLWERRIRSLSGGERARVLLARALAGEPAVLLADEPAAHLDVARERALMRIIGEDVRGRGMASLVVMHDLNLALRFADRIVLMAGGHVRLDAPPAVFARSDEVDLAFGQPFLRVEAGGHPALIPSEDNLP